MKEQLASFIRHTMSPHPFSASCSIYGSHRLRVYQKDWNGSNNSSNGDFQVMDKTIPSFRIVLAMEQEVEWKKPFRNRLDKSDRKKFSMR
jgi:hypothetical protein